MARPDDNLSAPPQELNDPLREFRPLFLVLAIGAGVQCLRGWDLFYSPLPQFTGYSPRELVNLVATNALAFAIVVTLYGMLPRKGPKAFYLRAFRNDVRTGLLRMDLQGALGRRFRLAGIRDPRRRSTAWIRYFFSGLFAIRYSLPKYMNLEAGKDWKVRLWVSLGNARCAVIDISDPTPFVRDEVALAVPRLGLHRTLFVSDGALNADECRSVAMDLLGAPDLPPSRIRVAVWSETAAGRSAFTDAVRKFVTGLPNELVDDEPPPPETAQSEQAPLRASDIARTALEVLPLIAVIFGAVHYAIEYRNSMIANFYGGAAQVLLAIVAFVMLAQMVQYLYVCGSIRERLRFSGVFLGSLLLAGYPLIQRFDQLKATLQL